MLIGISGKIGSGKDAVGQIIDYLYGLDNIYRNGGNPKDPIHGGLNVENIVSLGSPFNLWQTKKFADKLKETVALWLGVDRQRLEDSDFKNTVLGPEWDKYFIYNFGKPTNKILLTEEEAKAFCYGMSNSQHRFTYERIQLTVRKLMQLLGTECGRNIIHPNIWVNTLFNDYVPHNCRWIVTDVRFPNELLAVENRNGFMIRVNRFFHYRFPEFIHLSNPLNFYEVPTELRESSPELYTTLTHESDVSLDGHVFKHVLYNNGSLANLAKATASILVEEQLISHKIIDILP